MAYSVPSFSPYSSQDISFFLNFQIFMTYFSVYLIFSILLQYHFSKLFSYLLSASELYKAMTYTWDFINSFPLLLTLIYLVDLPSFATWFSKYLSYRTLSNYFWPILVCNGAGCLNILISFYFFTLISMTYPLVSLVYHILQLLLIASLNHINHSNSSRTSLVKHSH